MEGIKTDPKKVQGIMDLGRSATTAEARLLVPYVLCVTIHKTSSWFVKELIKLALY